MFDMSKCRIDDKLICMDGRTGLYRGVDPYAEFYPHHVQFSDERSITNYTNGGQFFNWRTDMRDIVDIVNIKPAKRIRKAKPENKLLGLLEWVSMQILVDMWQTDAYIYGAFRKGNHNFIYGYTCKKPYTATIGIDGKKPITVHTLNNFKGAVTKLLKG